METDICHACRKDIELGKGLLQGICTVSCNCDGEDSEKMWINVCSECLRSMDSRLQVIREMMSSGTSFSEAKALTE